MRRLALFQVQSPGPVFSCFVLGQLHPGIKVEEVLRNSNVLEIAHPIRCLEVATQTGSTSMYLPYPFLTERQDVQFGFDQMVTMPVVVTEESHPAIMEAYDRVLTEHRARNSGLQLAKP